MSLNYDLSQIENYKELDFGTIQHMTFGCLFVGLSGITEENAPEWYARMVIVEQLEGPLRRRGSEPVRTTPEEVKRYIGLSTNVSTETRAKFLGRYTKPALDQARRTYIRSTA